MTVAFYISYIALWVVVLFQTLLLLGLVRRQTTLIPDSPPAEIPVFDYELAGQKIPSFSGVDTSGARVDQSMIFGERAALLFVSPSCLTCGATLDDIEALRMKAGGRVIVVCQSSSEECRELIASYGLDQPVVVDLDRSISERFRVQGTPMAVLIAEDGRIEAGGHPLRGADLETFLTSNGVPA